jgi:hypothetical protein
MHNYFKLQPGGFMRVKVQEVGAGLHPSEKIVEVKTANGRERLVVDRRAVHNASLSIGSPIARKKNLWLIELPRETFDGQWRVWVKRDMLVEDEKEARAA